MLDIISALVDPDDTPTVDSEPVLPPDLFKMLSDSCLLPAIASYLRNDSGMFLLVLCSSLFANISSNGPCHSRHATVTMLLVICLCKHATSDMSL